MKLAVVMPRSRYASELEERSSESVREDSGNVACLVWDVWEMIVAVR